MRDEAHLESGEVATGPVVWIALGFLAFVAFSVGGLLLYFHLMVTGSSPIPPRTSAAPTLQSDPRADRLKLEERQSAELRSYGWVDREAGVAHIPIEDAMALVAARGQRAYDPLKALPTDGREGAR